MRCFRDKVHKPEQQMADLPSGRTTPSRPFTISGVDFGGPLQMKAANVRSSKRWKAYIALFVCFATKAVHLELVSDLSSQAFLACLRRFVSRRGIPRELHSDNGTNFVGANNQLRELYKLVSSSEVTNFLSNERMSWKFIPPRAPHFGGLWEAGIKSVKRHLSRVVGDTILTFEELSTLLTQIEACLNSRPLCQISNDPHDDVALTPGHFLTGGPLVSLPDENVSNDLENRLSRWQLIQRTTQQFWKRWSAEYLQSLQKRSKWVQSKVNLRVGDLVILKDEVRPLQWPLGRVTATHPGADNLVRVVTVKTKTGSFKRPIVKVIKLPCY
jgi:hypothetical protein